MAIPIAIGMVDPTGELFLFNLDLLARVAKLVDAPSSGGGAARCAGSNPVPGTFYLFFVLRSRLNNILSSLVKNGTESVLSLLAVLVKITLDPSNKWIT